METLADWIERDGSLTEKDAVGWVLRLAKRIEALHALGVAHGNISPACVCADGAACSSRGVLVDVRETAADPHYHSPERASGASLSATDDVWALAATLYACVTGQPPFGGTGEAEAHQRILSGTNPAPLAVFDVGDDELQRVFDAAFQRDPGRRTTRLAALRAALEKWSPEARALPPLEDGGEDGDDEDDDDEDARTVMRGPVDMAGLISMGIAGPTGGPRAPQTPPNSAMGGPRAPQPLAGPLVGGPRAPQAPAGVGAGLVRPPGAPVPGPRGVVGGPRAPVPPAGVGAGAGLVRPPGAPVPAPTGGPRPPQAPGSFGVAAPSPALAARTPHGIPAGPIGAPPVGGRPPGLGVHSPLPGFAPGAAGPRPPLARPPGAPAGAPPLGARSPAPVPPAPPPGADSPLDNEESSGEGELRTMMMFDAAKNLVAQPGGGRPALLAVPADVAVPRDDDEDEAIKTTVAGSALSGGPGEGDAEEEPEDDLAKTAMLMVPPGLADARPQRRPAAGVPEARAAAPPAGVFVYAGRSAAKPEAAASSAEAEREAPVTAPAPPPAPLFGAGTPAPPLARGASEPTSPQDRIARLLGQAGFEPGASLDGPPEGDGAGDLASTVAFDSSRTSQVDLAAVAAPAPAAGVAAFQASPGASPGGWSPAGGSAIAPFVAPAAAPGYQATASGQYPAVVAGPDGSLGPAPAMLAPLPVAPSAIEPAQSQTTGIKVALLAALITLIVAALATILVMKSGLLQR